MTCTDLAPIKIFRKTNNSLAYTFELESDGSAIDITGATIYFTVKRTPDVEATDANAIIQKTATIVSGVGGTASVALTTSDTDIGAKTYYFDIRYINGGVNGILGVGEFIVESNITNKTS